MSSKREAALLHAIQTGVATDQSLGSSCGSPKHLRVGVNAAMCGIAALARIMIEKGIITVEEYQAALQAELEKEVARYEANLSAKLGRPVNLA